MVAPMRNTTTAARATSRVDRDGDSPVRFMEPLSQPDVVGESRGVYFVLRPKTTPTIPPITAEVAAQTYRRSSGVIDLLKTAQKQ